MFGLPEEVSCHVRAFMCPIRFDWRTCKVQEALLIRQEIRWLLARIIVRHLEGDLTRRETEEIFEWTIYGIKHSFTIYLGGRDPLGPPREEDYREYPLGWYYHQLHWIS